MEALPPAVPVEVAVPDIQAVMALLVALLVAAEALLGLAVAQVFFFLVVLGLVSIAVYPF
jgi:hypothetical protein